MLPATGSLQYWLNLPYRLSGAAVIVVIFKVVCVYLFIACNSEPSIKLSRSQACFSGPIFSAGCLHLISLYRRAPKYPQLPSFAVWGLLSAWTSAALQRAGTQKR